MKLACFVIKTFHIRKAEKFGIYLQIFIFNSFVLYKFVDLFIGCAEKLFSAFYCFIAGTKVNFKIELPLLVYTVNYFLPGGFVCAELKSVKIVAEGYCIAVIRNTAELTSERLIGDNLSLYAVDVGLCC